MIRRGRGRPDAADVHEHLAFLHAATVRIGGDLEPDQVVDALCAMAVPRVADVASAYLYEEVLTERGMPDTSAHALLRRAAVSRDESPGGGLLVGKVAAGDLAGPFAATMASAQLVVWPDPAYGRDGVECLLPQGWGGSLLAVPLRAGARVLGFTVLLREADRAEFDETDLLTASLLADQAALGVHKALLYQREARVADTLQRSMLPKRPPRVPGTEIAYRYLPGNPAAQVGGDWFDAIPLHGGRIALVMGDVMGHGVHSAAAMGRLRTAVRTLASLDPPPDKVLQHLDQLFDDTVGQPGEDYMATCVYCVYDPVARRCAIANAGHVPPVFVHPDGRTELIPVPPGVPLGVGNVPFRTIEVTAPDGGLLALCTDGLVESRDRDLFDGLTVLRESLAKREASPDELCESVLRALHSDEREDDVALLIARFDGIPSADVAHWMMRSHPRTPGNARRLITSTLTEWGLGDLVDVTNLLATELVTNAIRYTTRPITLRLQRTERLLCEVTDDDHRLPVLRDAGEVDENGRGIYLTSRLAHRWGASHITDGKAVWFELPT